jgi:hypothetical protein
LNDAVVALVSDAQIRPFFNVGRANAIFLGIQQQQRWINTCVIESAGKNDYVVQNYQFFEI